MVDTGNVTSFLILNGLQHGFIDGEEAAEVLETISNDLTKTLETGVNRLPRSRALKRSRNSLLLAEVSRPLISALPSTEAQPDPVLPAVSLPRRPRRRTLSPASSSTRPHRFSRV